jgi:hypothetical protein
MLIREEWGDWREQDPKKTSENGSIYLTNPPANRWDGWEKPLALMARPLLVGLLFRLGPFLQPDC